MWDVYGNPLALGHCEVHPSIPEPYPCGECPADDERREVEARMYAKWVLEQQAAEQPTQAGLTGDEGDGRG